MGKVKVLPPKVANAIAAGEVVERPASVVKELVENSVDAGARRVTVEVEGAGLALIRVTDDGSGMARDDAALAFERHATSKIGSADDLERITTMGFRGEALPSIAAVSRVRVLTSEAQDAEGTEVRVEAGGVPKVAPGAARQGTLVEVQELFHNVPARRKFLKSPASESAAIAETVAALALAHPSVHLRYFADGREVLNAPASGQMLDRILAVLGMAVADQMLGVEARQGATSLSGHTSRVSLTRSSAADQYFIVNGRPVRSKALSWAVRSAYKGRVMVGRHPVVVLHLTLPPGEVDVNVHPAKAEVRFREEKGLATFVEDALASALQSQAGVAIGPLRGGAPGGVPPAHSGPARTVHPTPAPAQAPAYQSALGQVALGLERLEPQAAVERLRASFEAARKAGKGPTVPWLEPLGQIGNKYIVARTAEGLAVVDQHAAAERYTYEALGDSLAAGSVEVQQLIEPVVLELHPREVDLALERSSSLKAVGFEVERFGARQLRVSSVPAILADHADARLLHDILTEALHEAGPSPDAELIDRIVAVSACHYSLRAGEAVDFRRMARVIENLYKCRNPFHCIHGRPTVIVTPFADLDRMFKRTGPS